MTSFQHQLLVEIPALRRYANILTRDKDSADDLVQDCLERAWKHVDNLEADAFLRAWLFTIMRNIYYNLKRKERNAPKTISMDEVQELSGQMQAPELPLQLEELEGFLMQMSINQREIIMLVAVEGLTYKEVSQILELPIGTVMSRLHRAREELRSRVCGDNQVLKMRQVE